MKKNSTKYNFALPECQFLFKEMTKTFGEVTLYMNEREGYFKSLEQQLSEQKRSNDLFKETISQNSKKILYLENLVNQKNEEIEILKNKPNLEKSRIREMLLEVIKRVLNKIVYLISFFPKKIFKTIIRSKI